jgi:hypothetical protein
MSGVSDRFCTVRGRAVDEAQGSAGAAVDRVMEVVPAISVIIKSSATLLYGRPNRFRAQAWLFSELALDAFDSALAGWREALASVTRGPSACKGQWPVAIVRYASLRTAKPHNNCTHDLEVNRSLRQSQNAAAETGSYVILPACRAGLP